MEVDPAFPSGLCRGCYDDTLAASAFKNLCTQSAHHWTEGTTYLSQIYPPTDEDKAYIIYYSQEKTIVVDQAERIPTVKAALDRLNTTYEYYEPEKEKARRGKRSVAGKKAPCSCPDCGKTFTGPDNLNHHLRNSLKRACRKCCIVIDKQKMAKHLQSHNIKVYDCHMCHKLFENASLLDEHFKEDHVNGSFSCGVCGNGYVNDRALRAHAHAHSLFHCKTCNVSFENFKCYKYHQKQCESLHQPPVEYNSFTCDYCGVNYNRKPSLRIHIIQKHLNVLPHQCQVCGKRTSTLAHLRSHEKVHTTERKIFQCYCGAKLRTELGYQLHQRIHTGERPYECEHCGDSFLSSSRRLDHIKRRHRGAQDFKHVCKKCSARFVRPCELKKHYMAVHYTVVEVLPAKREINPQTRRLRNTIEKNNT